MPTSQKSRATLRRHGAPADAPGSAFATRWSGRTMIPPTRRSQRSHSRRDQDDIARADDKERAIGLSPLRSLLRVLPHHRHPHPQRPAYEDQELVSPSLYHTLQIGPARVGRADPRDCAVAQAHVPRDRAGALRIGRLQPSLLGLRCSVPPRRRLVSRAFVQVLPRAQAGRRREAGTPVGPAMPARPPGLGHARTSGTPRRPERRAPTTRPSSDSGPPRTRGGGTVNFTPRLSVHRRAEDHDRDPGQQDDRPHPGVAHEDARQTTAWRR